MEMMLIMMVFGIILSVAAAIGIRKIFSRKSPRSSIRDQQIHIFIESMKAVGELVVFKVFTKEIVTTADHWFGEWGKKYLAWLVSKKKLAMIFEFVINFRYDLKSPHFDIIYDDDGKYIVKMPPCLYDNSIKDISFYDEQRAKLFPWLLGEFTAGAFGIGFSEDDRNKLKNEALGQASIMATKLIKGLTSDIERSARQTIEMLAKSFGAKFVILDFSKSGIAEESVTDISQQQFAEA